MDLGPPKVSRVLTPLQDETDKSDGHRIDDRMLICQHNAEFGQATGDEEDCDWSLAAKAYPELREMPSYIASSVRSLLPRVH